MGRREEPPRLPFGRRGQGVHCPNRGSPGSNPQTGLGVVIWEMRSPQHQRLQITLGALEEKIGGPRVCVDLAFSDY